MNSRSYLLGKLAPFKNNVVKLSEYQSSNDIIKQILTAHEEYKNEYDKISSSFWKGNLKSSLNYVFNFLKENVKYKIEPDSKQSVKSPAAILAQAFGDCKHYSSFFGGLIDSWKRKGIIKESFVYRFANYKLFNTTPHHVFVVVKPGASEIWCDAVLSGFDYKKPYINKIDKKVMALYKISGFDCCDNYAGIGLTRKQKRRSGDNCTGRTVAKYAPPLIASRKAFLLLVRLNFRKTALKLYIAFKNPQAKTKILQKWCSLGGNAQTLVITVNKAVAKYKRKHPAKFAQIGVLPAALTAAWASAQPVIIALAPLLALAAKFLPEGSRGKEILETTSEAAESANTNEGQSGFGASALMYAAGIGALYFLNKRKRY